MRQPRIVRSIAVLAGAVALLVAALTLPASAAQVRSVKGTVVAADSTPIAGLTVYLTATAGDADHYDRRTKTTTSSKGTYSFSGFSYDPEDSYRVLVVDPKHRYVSTVRDFSPGSAGKTVTRNVTMKPAGSLTGKITRADGKTPTTTRVVLDGPNVDIGTPDKPVPAYDDDNGVRSDGTYRFVGLPAGDYTVRFDDPTEKYLPQCYDDALAEPVIDGVYRCEEPEAETVEVTAGAVSTLDDQQLDHAGAHVRGTVTDTSGRPIKDASVIPVLPDGDPGTYQDVNSWTRSTGRFDRGPLPAGSYRLGASAGGYQAEWYDDSLTEDGAQVLTLSPGELVTGIDFELKERPSIRATTKPGDGTMTFTIKVTRKGSGTKASGQVTVTLGDRTKTAVLSGGTATLKLTQLPAGTQTFRIFYSGSPSTVEHTTKVVAKVG